MTIAAGYTPNQYIGNGATATYPFGFKVLDEAHLVVIRTNLSTVATTLQVNVDFTVTGVGGQNGDITLLAGNLTTGFGLSISREVPVSQPTSLRTQGQFQPEALEDALDRIVMFVQQTASPPSGVLLGLAEYTDATKPAAASTYKNKLIVLKNPGQPAYVQMCIENANGTFDWATIATGNP